MTQALYIGLMSGTSMDGIDAALVTIDDRSCAIKATVSPAYPDALRQRLEQLVAHPHDTDLAQIGGLHTGVAHAFAAAVTDLLTLAGLEAADVVALGSHGQTVFHRPGTDEPFSMQLGDPGMLAVLTGITVVADFRNADLALGGQGAPLVPAFHRWLFGSTGTTTAVVNIGGIANVTLLHADGATTGFDTGPGNGLLDLWCYQHRSRPFDENGRWAASGSVDSGLLKQMRDDPYFRSTPPKSTGREYFNANWLTAQLERYPSSPCASDIQATLSELTAAEIAAAIRVNSECTDVAVCGGGAYNGDLMQRLQKALPECTVDSTARLGIDPAWVESAAFAWLAHQRLLGRATNVPAVTGASRSVCLGGVFLPPGL
jgi:anhydro-N-acetylmuramic acid kinase